MILYIKRRITLLFLWIYSKSPHPPSCWRRSPFSTKLGRAERAKVGCVVSRRGVTIDILHEDFCKIGRLSCF